MTSQSRKASHLRRDVDYTPDYNLSRMPEREWMAISRLSFGDSGHAHRNRPHGPSRAAVGTEGILMASEPHNWGGSPDSEILSRLSKHKRTAYSESATFGYDFRIVILHWVIHIFIAENNVGPRLNGKRGIVG